MTRSRQTSSRPDVVNWALIILVSVAPLISGCSSMPKADDPATLVYVGSSDDTWTAMHIALIELDYDVVSEDRNEGRIKATRAADGTRPASVLTIDQVARTETISLYVRAEPAPGDSSMDAALRRDLAEEILEQVKALLYK